MVNMNIKVILLSILLLLSLYLFTGCTSAQVAKFQSLGSKHKITLYSGGVAVRVWHSTGYIQNEEKSDGYYFKDDATGKLVSVSGQIVIEQE
jgi:hypothetical protein